MALVDPGLAFFLIRHGETPWNREGRLQGQHDVALNPLGRDQAAGAGRILKRLLRREGVIDPASIDFVASPLGRAQETMRIVRGVLGLPPAGFRLDPRLSELSFGAWEGRTWAEVKRVAPELVRNRKRDKWGFVPPGGESYGELAERLRPWLATVIHNQVVVAHGGVARVLMTLVAGHTTADAPNLDIPQGRVLVFSGGRCTWV